VQDDLPTQRTSFCGDCGGDIDEGCIRNTEPQDFGVQTCFVQVSFATDDFLGRDSVVDQRCV
jgi:hypothetical protein